ncbi:MAG: SDR family oxidoreductase [Pirellulaceae bacterium]|nr:SDR family oxidoreductase [Pirellulaceae bacterium]
MSPAKDFRPVALVTGSGRQRVGNVVARSLAEWGYDLGLHYRTSACEAEQTAEQLASAGCRAVPLQADVSDERQVERMFDTLLERFGRLDVLVTTASIWDRQPLEQVTADDVLRSFGVNTLGTFLCCRRGGLIMAGQETGGSIITFGDWAIQRPYRDYAAYFTAKGSLPTLTRMFAVELASRNPRVRVNCIHPGPVMFPDDMTADERQQVIAATLVKQADCPDSVSQAVRFFIDNPFVTGVCLPVDGGRSIFAGP